MKRKILFMMGLLVLSLAIYAQKDTVKVDSLGISPALLPMTLSSVSPATLGSTVPNIVPPSPHAAELGRFGAVSVGLYTGTVQHSIPIFELKNEHLSLPISLNYSSNGFMVDKLASWVGYDWSLNAGGIITRYRKGKTDIPGSRPYSSWGSLSTSEKLNLLDLLVGYEHDLQPDIFAVSLPGYSFKFVFDNDGDPVTIPYTPVKIATNSTGAFTYFHITTPDGIVYKFEDNESTAPPSESSFNTAWHLSEILHPTGDKITFTYSSYSIAQKVGIDRKVMVKISSSGGDPAGSCNNSEFKEQITSINNTISYLSQIDFVGVGKVVFEKSSGRSDALNEYKLDKITIKDDSGNALKSFQLNYQFPQRTATYSCQITTTTDVNYRMFLTSLNEKDASSSTIKTYNFEYNSMTSLPARFSYAQDHWGYFNGKYNNDLVSINDVPSTYQGLFSGHVGSTADRSPNYLYSKKGMLYKITYPTGGYTTFEYEANKNSSGIQIGGCRILRTKSYTSSAATPIIKKYNYLQASTFGSLYPTYYQSKSTYYDYDFNMGHYTGECVYGILSSNSLNNVYVDGQNMVCYPSVEVLAGENGENGKDKYSYHVVFDTPGIPVSGGQIQPIPVSNTGWSSGNLEQVLFSDNGSNSIKKAETNYNFSETRNKVEIPCLASNKRLERYFPSNEYQKLSYYDVVPYTLHSNWFYVSSSVVTHYESGGNVTSTTSNSFENANHCQITQQIMTNSDGVQHKNKWRYPHDYGSVSNFTTLKNKNIIAKPVDIRQYMGSQLSSGIQNKYNDDGQPIDVYSAEPTGTDISFSTTNPYTFTHKLKFDYNTKDVIKQITNDDSFNTVYLRDATGNYVMAKIENATYSQVSSQDGKTFSYASKTLYNSLKSLVPDALITTFTYKRLVGITQQTDPSGVTTYYEYDSFGRLSTVKNDDSKILNKYDYHYAN
jgi:YD repeat-containing protein